MLKNRIRRAAALAAVCMLLVTPMSHAAKKDKTVDEGEMRPMISQITNKMSFNKTNVFRGDTLSFTAETEFGNFGMTNPFTSCMDISFSYNGFETPRVSSNNTGQSISWSYLSSDAKVGGSAHAWQSGTHWFYVPKTWTVSGTARVRTNAPLGAAKAFNGQKDKTWNSSGYDAVATIYVN